jgi:hypothetical protein
VGDGGERTLVPAVQDFQDSVILDRPCASWKCRIRFWRRHASAPGWKPAGNNADGAENEASESDFLTANLR